MTKIRVMHGESFVTYCGYGEYTLEVSDFPELEGMDGDDIADWLYDHSDEVCVDSEDYSKIVPYADDLCTLQDAMSDATLEWDKIKGEERYINYLGEVKSDDN